MATTARKPRALPYAVNPDTHEVFERVPESQWTAKHAAWVKCIGLAHKSSDYHFAALPRPMPWGHVMFLTRKGNHYRPCAIPPEPVWTDGVSALYAGQRVGWCKRRDYGYWDWFYGHVIALHHDGKIGVRCADGTICPVDPYLPEL